MTEEFVDEINRCYPDDAKELSEKGYDGETLTDGYFESFVTITVRIIHDADGNIIDFRTDLTDVVCHLSGDI